MFKVIGSQEIKATAINVAELIRSTCLLPYRRDENIKYFKRENIDSNIQFVVPPNMTLNSLARHDLKTAVSLKYIRFLYFWLFVKSDDAYDEFANGG